MLGMNWTFFIALLLLLTSSLSIGNILHKLESPNTEAQNTFSPNETEKLDSFIERMDIKKAPVSNARQVWQQIYNEENQDYIESIDESEENLLENQSKEAYSVEEYDPKLDVHDVWSEVEAEEEHAKINAFKDINDIQDSKKAQTASRLREKFDNLLDNVVIDSINDYTDSIDKFDLDDIKILSLCWNLRYLIEEEFGKINYMFYEHEFDGESSPSREKITDKFDWDDMTYDSNLYIFEDTVQKRGLGKKNRDFANKLRQHPTSSEDNLESIRKKRADDFEIEGSGDSIPLQPGFSGDGEAEYKERLRNFIYQLMWCDLKSKKLEDDEFEDYNKDRKTQLRFLRRRLKTKMIEERLKEDNIVDKDTNSIDTMLWLKK